jgi:glycerol-3-phosphate O-acyltransferase/dihydroxyacetone phosphate acyltransferase
MAPHVPVPQHSATGWVYDLVLKIFSSMVGLFFREIQFRGTWRVPSRGPIILVAGPHSNQVSRSLLEKPIHAETCDFIFLLKLPLTWNQFVDSVILMRILRSLNRRISWLMAEKSFHRPFVGAMARLIGAVPVSRAMDLAKAGEGTIYLPEPVISPLLLRGIGTDFTGPAFKAGCSIYLPTINGEAHKLDIAEIRGPTELILKLAPGHSDALFQLTGKRHPTINQSPREFKGSKFKVSPHVDQTEVYNAVFETLDGGGCIGIFPEGGSHDRTSMLPLKGSLRFL